MGHLNNVKKAYKDLQQRLDKYPVGAPDTRELYEILRMMFTEEQAALGARMPIKPMTSGAISRKLKMKEDDLRKQLDEMAFKGLVIDFYNPKNGKLYYMLAPTVVGFFEFSMMRVRTDIPQKEVAEMLYEYMIKKNTFAVDAFQGTQQIGRAIVHEPAIEDGDFSEILDWERASELVDQSEKVAVALCYCRHKARHNDHACGAPEEICMTIGPGADYVIRRNLGRETDKKEIHELLAVARENNLVHIADNVQKNPIYICNCCGCCCGQLSAINIHGISTAVRTSNVICKIDLDNCKGCGKCAKACPINAIEIKETRTEEGKKKKWAVVDESVCLGCGVCHGSCKFEGIKMEMRKKRTLTPVSTLDRVLTMAMERGKLQHFLFDDMKEGPTKEFLVNLTGAVMNMPAAKQLLLKKEVKSKFLEFATGNTGSPD